LQQEVDGPVRLLYVGRFNVFKNVETLIEAVAKLGQMNVVSLSSRWWGRSSAHTERMVSDLGLTRRVHFAGWVARDRIATVTARRHLHYRLYLGGDAEYCVEPLPGLPIVGTQVSGLHELVRDGVNGYLTPIKDADALAEAIALLIQNGYERRRMGRQSRKLVEREFAWEFIAEQYVAIYRQVLQERYEAQPDR
jgi:glycosyltransferase involved in cell wall biosynthesis